MELTEISDRIDAKLNTYEIPIEVDEYEKSIYMTMAQKLFYKNICDHFEEDGTIAVYLQPFVNEFITTLPINTVTKPKMVNDSINIVVPNDIYRVIWEKAILKSVLPKYNLKEVKVLKTNIDTIPYKLDNPFRQPNNKEIYRIITGNVPTAEVFELILPKDTELLQYTCKYLRDIEPIILEQLPIDLTIEGIRGPSNTDFIHEIVDQIIDMAVEMIRKDKLAVSQQKSV